MADITHREIMMNIRQCQKLAQEVGYNSMKFRAEFPGGEKKCQWIDAYFGFFVVEGFENEHLQLEKIEQMYPNLICAA